MALNDDLLDKLIEGYHKPEDLIGENGLLKQNLSASSSDRVFRSGHDLLKNGLDDFSVVLTTGSIGLTIESLGMTQLPPVLTIDR
jgi:hypothetical protein